MNIINKKAWKKGLKNNTDSYGAEIYRYAEEWANLMEEKMEQGEKLEDIAKDTSHKADATGITGFMYGAAVSILANIWEHGEELRKWHNLDIQIGNEGEKANESKTVLNPALVTMSINE